jgi:raffinose/stachyose/melibiose transport system permease protein
MEKILGNKRAILVFTLPSLFLFTIIMIVSIFVSGFFSLLNWDGLGKMTFNGLSNFYDILIGNRDNFWLTFKNASIMAIMSTFIQIPLALILALALASKIKGEGFFRTAFFIPCVISSSAIAQLFLKIYNPDYGLLNELLHRMNQGSLARAWLYDEKTALISAFIPMVWQHLGYHMLILYAGIKAIPIEIHEAATIDGAGSVQMAFHITIPLITPMLEVVLTLAIVGSLKVFDTVFILTSNGEPLGLTLVQTGLMYKLIFERNIYGRGSALAVFVIFECLLFTLLIQGVFRKINTWIER